MIYLSSLQTDVQKILDRHCPDRPNAGSAQGSSEAAIDHTPVTVPIWPSQNKWMGADVPLFFRGFGGCATIKILYYIPYIYIIYSIYIYSIYIHYIPI